MDNKKHRSSLRKSVALDVGTLDIKAQLKRRISFSGKHLVREFHGEEEPKTWNNSYEISDHLNVDETVSDLFASSKSKVIRSVIKKSQENKENTIRLASALKLEELQSNQQAKNNTTLPNNIPAINVIKDLDNVSFQNSNLYQIENSVDITLYEREMKFCVEKERTDQRTSNIYSFSLDENEKESRSTVLGERTIDFMRDLKNDSQSLRGDDHMINDTDRNQRFAACNEHMNEDLCLDFSCKKSDTKGYINIYMDKKSLSMSGTENDFAVNSKMDKTKPIQQQTIIMKVSPSKAKQEEKENINPVLISNANETINNSCQKEIEDYKFSQCRPNMNVEKESNGFQDKLNQLPFLQDLDDKIQMGRNTQLHNVVLNMKYRPTINFNQPLEISPQNTKNFTKISKNARETINFNQPIQLSPKKNNKCDSIIDGTVYNEPMEFSPDYRQKDLKKNTSPTKNSKSRQTINFNQSIEEDSQNIQPVYVKGSGAIPKIKARQTIDFNQPIEVSPIKVKSILPTQTINCNEDICVSPQKSSKECVAGNNLNISESISSKNSQQPKLVLRKICTPLVNYKKMPVDSEQQRLMRYKKKQEQHNEPNVKNNNTSVVTITSPIAEKSLNFSLSSVKNMSLSPESSSLLIPSEFKAYNLKQLNDEIERGKIHVFSNASKTLNTDRKMRISFHFESKNIQSSLPSTKHKRTLVFEDVDIPVTSNDSLFMVNKNGETNHYVDFNITQHIKQQENKNIARCRYSQADDIMLDNTSFLARAKLSDETVSRNSSKREMTQLNNITDIFDGSVREAGNNFGKGIIGSNVKLVCNNEDATLCAMLQNAKPIFTQTITNIRDNYKQNKSAEADNCFNKYNCQQRQTLHLIDNIESCVSGNNNDINQDKNNVPIQCIATDHTAFNSNNDIEIEEECNRESEEKKPFVVEKNKRQTIYPNNDTEELNVNKNMYNYKRTLFSHDIVDHDNPEQINDSIEKVERRIIYSYSDIDKLDISDQDNHPDLKVKCARQTTCIETGFEVDCMSLNKKDIGTPIFYENDYRHKSRDFDKIRCKQVMYSNKIVTDKMEFDDENGQNSLELLKGNDDNINDENPTMPKNKYLGANIETGRDQKTLIFDQTIELDDNGEKSPQQENTSIKNIEKVETRTDKTILNDSNPSRKTLYFHSEIIEIDSIDTQNKQKISGEVISDTRQSVYVAERKDVTLDDIKTEQEDDKKNTKLRERDVATVMRMNNDNVNMKFSKNDRSSRKSVYTIECMDLTLDGFQVNEKEFENQCNSNKIMQDEKSICVDQMDLILDEVDDAIKASNCDNKKELLHTTNEISLSNSNDIPANKEKRKTTHFKNNDMSMDQSFMPAENFQFPELVPLNAAKIALERHKNSTLLTNKLKNILNNQHNALITPVKTNTTNHRLFYMTPRLSLLEFTAAEKRVKEEEVLQNKKYFSPAHTEFSIKRFPVHLTPVLSIPKKRQTLVFDNCLMDESGISQTSKNETTNYNNIEMGADDERCLLSERKVNDDIMDISCIVSNESILQTPPRLKQSRIPIPMESGKKLSRCKSILNTSSDCQKERKDQPDMEGDILTESIQLMRKVTTFTQTRDAYIGNTEKVDKKPSIFEGNPITISDVSVFFESHRKNHTDVPQTDASLVISNEINMSGVNAMEAPKNDLENLYIHLTLEDIDKTRLSLVRASYEDEDDHDDVSASDQNSNNYIDELDGEEIILAEPVNNRDDEYLKSKHYSQNNIRNASAVCRKCKRCQDTLLNETISSTSESFVMPSLLPLPNLGIDRLRRLRKRPAVSDVNVLWQRVSLDRTIINAINISDDSQIILDIEDDIQDDSSQVGKCIRKYEKDMKAFEMDLMERKTSDTCVKKLPFVLRLNALLSNNLSNWIFDFQKQCRGILVFTHRKMLTFSVLLAFDEVDPLGYDINLKTVKLEKGHVSERYWKPIDFVLDFQLKLNLPFELQSLCECSNEVGIFKMLETIDRVCLDTIKMGNCLQKISFSNQASLIRDECRTYVRKIIRKIVSRNDTGLKENVEKTEIKVELLNLKKLSFKDISTPALHNFREEIHLLPIGLQFLNEFLLNPLNYLKTL